MGPLGCTACASTARSSEARPQRPLPLWQRQEVQEVLSWQAGGDLIASLVIPRRQQLQLTHQHERPAAKRAILLPDNASLHTDSGNALELIGSHVAGNARLLTQPQHAAIQIDGAHFVLLHEIFGRAASANDLNET